MTEINFSHTPVMLNECIDALNIRDNHIYVDGTTGGAGHTKEILSRFSGGAMICIDKDSDALRVAKDRVGSDPRVKFVKSDFKEFENILNNVGIDKVDGILLDLGVSSYQLDTPSRGFSYRFDSKLDMRMDEDSGFSAYDVVNNYSEYDLRTILYKYGEEPNAYKIAKKIVEERAKSKIETTERLKEIILSCMPKKLQGIGACKKTFQAIRIEVNGELDRLEDTLYTMINHLNVGGRLAVITFHSLEDRIVKDAFKRESSNCICDKSQPICTCGHKATIKLINKKPIVASQVEVSRNSRSASAKLRVIEKL